MPLSEKEKAEIKAALDRATQRIGAFEDKYGSAYQTKPKKPTPKTLLSKPKKLEVTGKKQEVKKLKVTKSPYYKGVTNKRQADQLRKLEE